jgi:hypothetical protein
MCIEISSRRVGIGDPDNTPLADRILGDTGLRRFASGGLEFMTVESWKATLEIAELFLKCGAIVGAAAWAAYTFRSLGQIARAKADIAKTEAERRKAEAEIERLSEQGKIGAVVQIQMTPTVQAIPGDQNTYLSVTAEFLNTGSRNAQVDYAETPFAGYAVTPKADGTFDYERVVTAHVVNGLNPSLRSKRLVVRAGGKERLNFFVKLPGSGLYFLVVSVPISEREQNIARQFGFESKGRWSAKQYFVVP